jgi:TatD DNase family protein
MFADTHIHLYSEEFDADRDQLIHKAIKNNITKFYLPNVDSESIVRMHDLEKNYPENCFAMMGLHPCSVKENVDAELKIVEEWLKKRKYAAIGEIGIDLYWDKTFYQQQVHAFKTQIQWAIDHNYSIIIHCRDAFDEVYDCLTSFKTLPKGIFHCFSGNVEQAKKIIALNNFKLGIGGVLTFKNSGLDKVVSEIDIEYLVLETDAPYLAPVPHRGKRNEPAFILEVAKRLAEIKEISMFDVEEITLKNAQFIFP